MVCVAGGTLLYPEGYLSAPRRNGQMVISSGLYIGCELSEIPGKSAIFRGENGRKSVKTGENGYGFGEN